jgi:hypothetical protein
MKTFKHKKINNCFAIEQTNGKYEIRIDDVIIFKDMVIINNDDWELDISSHKINYLKSIDNLNIICKTFDEFCKVLRILGERHSHEWLKVNYKENILIDFHSGYITEYSSYSNYIEANDFILANPLIITTIDNIEIYDEERYIYLLNSNFNLTKCCLRILDLENSNIEVFANEDYAKKYVSLFKPKFTFKTKDGVVINNPDKDVYFGYQQYENKVYTTTFVKASEAARLPIYNYFSSKEKAEEYIDLTEIKFNKEDIIKIYENFINKNDITNFKEYLKTI